MTSDVNILVVDDDHYLLDLLIETLRSIGYETTGVSSAKKALRYLESSPVDLVITDIRMPGMDGLEFAQKVKEYRPGLPVIFITGAFNPSILQTVDAEGFLSKPFRIGQIEELIEEVLSAPGSPDIPEEGDLVLVVDDDETFRLMLMETLRLSGYKPVGAPDGDGALSIMESKPIGAVITDVKMPGMGGIELAGRIKERWPGTPVIIITGYMAAEHEKPIKTDAADGFLMKPFKIESITELLEDIKRSGDRTAE